MQTADVIIFHMENPLTIYLSSLLPSVCLAFSRGQFEYELVLKTDVFTKRHTQWYYFRVRNMIPGIIYKFRIVNLLKRDSLYNHGKKQTGDQTGSLQLGISKF